MLNFKECTLTKLEKLFGLKQVRTLPKLTEWLNENSEIADLDRQTLLRLREKLIRNVHDWNETELAYNFIGPVMAFADFTTEYSNFFAERPLNCKVDGIELTGRPDGMIASGVREPEVPYFCLQEYKKETDPEGDPAAQVLAAMLVAQELNTHNEPIYGCYVKGSLWYFMILQLREYCITEPYVATKEDLFDIFRVLQILKLKINRWCHPA